MSLHAPLSREKLRSLINQNKLNCIEKVLAKRSDYVTFAFERLYHEHNIDAGLRSIEACGFQTVHIIENEKRINPSVTVTKGADYWLTMNHYAQPETNNVKNCFEKLHTQGYRIVGTMPTKKAYSIADLPLDKKIALVIGNERLGLSDYAREHVDTYVTIPMYGFTESFNASVSVALLAYELRRRLEKENFAWHITQQEQSDLELIWLTRLIKKN